MDLHISSSSSSLRPVPGLILHGCQVVATPSPAGVREALRSMQTHTLHAGTKDSSPQTLGTYPACNKQ